MMHSHTETNHDYIAKQSKPSSKRPSLKREFSLLQTTEWNNRTDDELYYGPHAHIRKAMDYSYHSNYNKTRQWLQDSIIEKLMGEFVRTRACNKYELMTSESNTPAVLTNTWAMPKEPWLIMATGEKGTDKGRAIKLLLENDRLPVMGFVLVDPQEIRLLLPEYSHLEKKDVKVAIERTEKETGYIIEILTLAALEAGTNVMVYACIGDIPWHQQYCQRLKLDFKHLRIAVLHVVTDTEGEGANSFSDLVPHIDYLCRLKIFSEVKKGIEIMTDGATWDSFTKLWQQSCAWVPKNLHGRRSSSVPLTPSLHSELSPHHRRVSSTFEEVISKKSRHPLRSIVRFCIEKSTEEIHASSDMHFYGPYAHIRKTLDYSYHSNYTRERQLLQDAIISDFMTTPKIVDGDGQVGTTPTEPFIVFTAGAMGAGKGYVLNYMNQHGYFPLSSFVTVDPDEIRNHFPEYNLYISENPLKAGELTRKEAGYIVEILSYATIQAGKNVLVDGSLRDWEWYEGYFARLREEYSCVKISILHIDAPKDEVIKRAMLRGVVTGRKIPQETLEMAIKQVPISVTKLKNQVDSYYKLNNSPNSKDVELMNEECTWENFKQNWIQTCAWIPEEREENNVTERGFPSMKIIPPL